MKTSRFLAVATLMAAALFMLQAPLQARADDDPPGRVARLDYTDGSVSAQPGGQGDWVEATKNRPLTSGDNLWADKDSKAELQIGSTDLRVGSETSITILQLDDQVTQIRLSQGAIIVRVRHLDDGDNFEIDTPNSAFKLLQAGEYRVDVNADGNETDTTVFKGRGEVTGGGSSFDVVADQLAKFTGTDQLNHEIDQVPAADDFDKWAFSQDDREDHSESANYISPEVTGSEDLDDNGSWHYVADYGEVWSPTTVAVGWAPYRFGHWVWVGPWGWTWVEDEPWGFAPFHYGRWAFVGAGWCWVPGPVVVRPVYAPALVAFVGGGGFSFGFGAGVAWFPLAPREVFVPWYHTSVGYVNNVNITNTRVNVTNVTNVYNNTNINNIHYQNQHVANGVTAVSHDTFVNARPVASNLAKVDSKQLENAPVSRNMPVEPTKQSSMGAGRVASAKPPASVANRQVVATRQPTTPGASSEVRQAPAARSEAAGEPARQAGGEPARPTEASRAVAPHQGSVPRPPAGEGGHPLVKQAPPVQERPGFQQSEEQKFNAWRQQRAAAPHPAPHSAPHAAAPHGGKSK